MRQTSARGAARRAAGTDPLRAIAHWGGRASRAGAFVGVLVGIIGHVGMLHALATLGPQPTTQAPPQRLERTFDVDIVTEPVAPTPEAADEPPPVAEPEPVEPDARQPDDDSVAEAEPPDDSTASEPAADPYDGEVAAAPSEAADVLTRPEDGPIDLTGDGWSIVDGKGAGPIYGYKSKRGRAERVSFDKRTRLGGVDGGRGSRAAGRGRVGSDRSRPAGVIGGRSWSCPFPPEADQHQVNSAVAVVVVSVSPNGRPASVRVVSDPGYGFGRMAKQCAQGRSYRPALDAAGRPIASTTPPINVRFRR